MLRIIALTVGTALGVSTAFAGNLNPVEVEQEPVVAPQPVATGSMGNAAQRAAVIGVGALAIGGIIWAVTNDDNGDDVSSSATTSGGGS